MVILASLPRLNLFSSLPSSRPPNDPTASSSSHSLPIPIPKYTRSNRNAHNNQVRAPKDSLAFKLPHRKTKYYKPVKHGDVISLEGDGSRAVVVGESGVSYHLPGAPFEYQFSYSETPKAKPLAIREPAYLPFAPPSMPRPWTGKPPLKKDKEKKKVPLPDALGNVGMTTRFHPKTFPSEERTREEILGEPLERWEIMEMIKPMIADNRQVNLGRDGVTHNMLNLVHSHWKRRRVCKVRCKGVPTVDMNNVCRVLEDKTGGKIIHRVGGVVYLYRGRNYKPHPEYPLMLWKPAAPVYPKLIQEAPEGLTKSEADEFKAKGKTLLPICKLAKNGVYVTLVRDVRTAFELSPLVKIDCEGMHASDYKKLAAKLKELVPCVLLSFDDGQILMWRGQNWKPKYAKIGVSGGDGKGNYGGGENLGGKTASLWRSALDTNKAILLPDTNVDADALLEMVEEFARVTQATEHTYEADVVDSEDSMATSETDEDEEMEDFYVDLDAPHGTLPIDLITKKLREGNRKF